MFQVVENITNNILTNVTINNKYQIPALRQLQVPGHVPPQGFLLLPLYPYNNPYNDHVNTECING